MIIQTPKRWIYLIECDFCFDKNVDLYCVEVRGEPITNTSCMECIKKKGWIEGDD